MIAVIRPHAVLRKTHVFGCKIRNVDSKLEIKDMTFRFYDLTPFFV